MSRTYLHIPLKDRFESKWTPEPNSGCWIWTGCILSNGYGQIHDHQNGQNVKLGAHHASWLLHRGKIPSGILVLHKCDTPLCVNPDHLFLGTQKDNAQDRNRKGRNANVKGTRHPLCRLSPEQIVAIRADKRVQTIIAKDFGISQSHVSAIKNKRFWSHI